jgi:hypothetical protein
MKIKADKYEFIFDEHTGNLEIHRHGEPWRKETGDGALLALMQRCEELSTSRSEEDERTAFELEAYDPCSLNDFGGGNVAWWHDYLRAELERAHDFYQSQVGEL